MIPPMPASHWGRHAAGFSRLGPPMLPDEEMVSAVRRQLTMHEGPTLLLGVTAVYADVAADVTAVDHNPEVVAKVWPGDTPTRRAHVEEWQKVSSLGRRFVAAVGDGSLNSIVYPDDVRDVLRELELVLEPGGRVVVRCFVTPDEAEGLAEVRAAVLDGAVATFHGFKWRLAMALVAARGDANIAVVDILAGFEAMFPDRDALAAATGWHPDTIATIDVYRGSDEVYSFPTASQLRAVVPSSWQAPAFAPSGTYELAERCPLLVVDLAP
jgi:hypothetical protein